MTEPIEITPLPESELPTIGQLKIGFDNIRARDFSDLSYEQVKAIILKEIKLLPTLLIQSGDGKTESGLELYRVRPANEIDSDNRQSVEEISTFSYPPKNKTTQNRANIRGYPVFYASENAHTAIYEVGLKVGDEFYVAEWHYNTTHSNLQVLLLNVDKENEFWYDMARSVMAKLDLSHKYFTKAGRNTIKYLYENVGELFLHDNQNLTSVLAHHVLYENRNYKGLELDSLIYPSIRKDRTSANFALHPDCVKSNLELKYVYRGKLDSKFTEGANISIQKIGQVNNGRIYWFELILHFLSTDIFTENGEHIFNIDKRNGLGEMRLDLGNRDISVLEFLKAKIKSELQNFIRKIMLGDPISRSGHYRPIFHINVKPKTLMATTTKGDFVFVEKFDVKTVLSLKLETS